MDKQQEIGNNRFVLVMTTFFIICAIGFIYFVYLHLILQPGYGSRDTLNTIILSIFAMTGIGELVMIIRNKMDRAKSSNSLIPFEQAPAFQKLSYAYTFLLLSELMVLGIVI